jgi:nicotinamide mononucleotide transporter
MADIPGWLAENYIEVFGAVTGILYVFLEIRQTIWLWPVGILTSGVYILVFFEGKLYADMSLQVYYLVISILGWYWWTRRKTVGAKENELPESAVNNMMRVTRLDMRTAVILSLVFVILFTALRLLLGRFTDSPVPAWDSFITSLSIVATWMLARKIYEHWFIWIVVNASASLLFFTRGLYPTVVLYIIYGIMSFAGLMEWRKSLQSVRVVNKKVTFNEKSEV